METITPFVSLDQLPLFQCNEQFNIFYVETTLGLLKPLVTGKNHLIQPNVFHTGLGIQAINSQIEFVFDFDGNNFLGSFLPIETNLNRDELVWDNGAVVNINSFINRKYWEHSHYVCTISMRELLQLSNYVLNWYAANPYYVFFAIVQTATPVSFFNTVYRNSICDTFVNDCLLFLQQNRTPIKFITTLSTSVGAVITGQNVPMRMDPNNNSNDKSRIINFYKLIYTILNALTPKTKLAASVNTSNRRPMGNYIESPEIRQHAVRNMLQLVHQNQGHVILYTYVPNTLADLGYFMLKLEEPYLYADYILYRPLMRTISALDTNYNTVPELD